MELNNEVIFFNQVLMRIFEVFELRFRGFIILGSVCKHIHEKKI